MTRFRSTTLLPAITRFFADKTRAEIEEEAARRVNGPYVIEATATPQGPRPAHIKDRIRALGPTVRPDLTLKPADPNAGSWVI